LVAANDDLELAGTAGDQPAQLSLAERERPDVVVTDIRMPPTGTDEGIQAAAWIRAHLPGTGVVVLSQYVAPAYAVALLEHGSAGRDGRQLHDALRVNRPVLHGIPTATRQGDGHVAVRGSGLLQDAATDATAQAVTSWHRPHPAPVANLVQALVADDRQPALAGKILAQGTPTVRTLGPWSSSADPSSLPASVWRGERVSKTPERLAGGWQ
jgi:CheY-like chemotaxis protein